jgi:phosphoribosylamine--glycine ligase
MASHGYPGSYATGKAIAGLERVPEGVTVFHAGTRQENGRVVTAGGRVLGVTALAGDLASARQRAYAAVEGINFEGRQFRRDIAVKGLSA